MATLQISGNNITSFHWLVFKTGSRFQNKPMYHISASGIARLGNSAKGSGPNWQGHTLIIHVNLSKPLAEIPTSPRQTAAPAFRARHWSVVAGLNSIFNQGEAKNSGHAVDSFELMNASDLNTVAKIRCNLAVRDVDAFLHKVGFKLSMVVYDTKHSGGIGTVLTGGGVIDTVLSGGGGVIGGGGTSGGGSISGGQ